MSGASLPTGALVIREHLGRPFYEAKWRDSTRRQVKRRLGPAWVERDGAGTWRKRRGRTPDGQLDEKRAIVAMSRVIEEHEAQIALVRPGRPSTFDDAAAEWLDHLERIDGVKPSTLADHRYVLAPVDAAPRKRGRRNGGGRVMREFGGQPLAKITRAQVDRWLSGLDDEKLAKRTVNKYRQIVCSVLEYAVSHPERFGITTNVARAAQKRREPDPGVLDFYEPEEVQALARAARAGLHRDPTRPAVSESEAEERRQADEQDAALYAVAAFTGLRAGELLALRWQHVSFERATLTVAESWSGGQLSSPKSRKVRTVPLATPAAAELARLADRGRWTDAGDLVFCSALGEPLDPSALRRRYARTQEAAGLRRLRFHDLRHSFGSLVVREVDTATLKSWMGHAKLTTTERYLHAKPRHSDVARLDRAFVGTANRLDGERTPVSLDLRK